MKGRVDKEDVETRPLVSSVTKDSSISLFRMIATLIIFVAGVVIGLASSSHIDKYFTFQMEQSYSKRSNAIGGILPLVNGANCTIVVRCEKEDCLSMKSFVRPRNLSHNMNDEELLWRASMVPTKVEFPYRRVAKVAFLFLTRGPLPFLPLWERFFAGQDVNLYSIYVHASPRFNLNATDVSVFFGRQIPSQNVAWGSVNLVDAEKRLLANALLDFSNERFVLLSESCIPVYNFPTVYDYLTKSTHSFVESYDDPSRYGRGRYSRRMKPNIRLSEWRKGSQWFEINRSLAIKIVSDTKYYTLFKKYCKPSCYPDEHYIPTYLQMFYRPQNSNRTVTYVDWSLGGPHPATFTRVNITEGFIQSIRNNGTLCRYNERMTPICYLFARKFDPSSLEPLLNISSTVMEF